jgi:hypothetical protein
VAAASSTLKALTVLRVPAAERVKECGIDRSASSRAISSPTGPPANPVTRTSCPAWLSSRATLTALPPGRVWTRPTRLASPVTKRWLT